eukprot:2674395-Pyramimonas_sp.AAC.1
MSSFEARQAALDVVRASVAMELGLTISRVTDAPLETVSQRARSARIVHVPLVQHCKNLKLAWKSYVVPLRWM